MEWTRVTDKLPDLTTKIILGQEVTSSKWCLVITRDMIGSGVDLPRTGKMFNGDWMFDNISDDDEVVYWCYVPDAKDIIEYEQKKIKEAANHGRKRSSN